MSTVHHEAEVIDLDLVETFDLDDFAGLLSDEPYPDECPVLPDSAYYPDDDEAAWWAAEMDRIARVRDRHLALYELGDDGDFSACEVPDFPSEYPCDGFLGHPA